MVEIAFGTDSISIDVDIAPVFPTFHDDGGAPPPFKRPSLTVTHILPSTMKAMPPNIFFSSTWRLFPMAVLTRFTSNSSGGIAVASSVVHGSDEWILASVAARRLS